MLHIFRVKRIGKKRSKYKFGWNTHLTRVDPKKYNKEGKDEEYIKQK